MQSMRPKESNFPQESHAEGGERLKHLPPWRRLHTALPTCQTSFPAGQLEQDNDGSVMGGRHLTRAALLYTVFALYLNLKNNEYVRGAGAPFRGQKCWIPLGLGSQAVVSWEQFRSSGKAACPLTAEPSCIHFYLN